MLYAILAINVLWLMMVTGFIAWAVGKGFITINYHKVMDKETSMELARQIEEEMKSGGEY